MSDSRAEAAQQWHAADAQISKSFIIEGPCAPLMPGVGHFTTEARAATGGVNIA